VPPLKWSKVLRARWSAQAWDVPRDEIDVNMSSIEFPNALILNLDEFGEVTISIHFRQSKPT
jgi:hypothetical protein